MVDMAKAWGGGRPELEAFAGLTCTESVKVVYF